MRAGDAAPLAAPEARLLARLLGAGLVLLAGSRLLLLVLCAERLTGFTTVEIAAAVTVGSALDLSFLTWLLLPVWALVFLPGAHWATRPRVCSAVAGWTGLATFLLLVGIASDLAHFREFDIRLNATSLDYLRQPIHLLSVLHHEFGLAPVLLALALATWAATRRTVVTLRKMARRVVAGPRRALVAVGTLAVLLGLGAGAPAAAIAGLDVVVPGQAPHAYLTDQISRNGTSAFVEACLTELGDEEDVRTRFAPEAGDHDAAVGLLRESLADRRSRFDESGPSPIARTVDTGVPLRRRNVVIVLLESFCARGIAGLGGAHDDAPEFDRLSRDGLLFTNLHATGTRTNRGMAGVLSSLPSLPGLSPVCTLSPGERSWTVGSELADRGYRSLAICGGDREYDNFERFVRAGGFERVVARDDFRDPALETEWGVSDEDLFARSVEELDALAATGDPFLGFVLTLSNHRPYRVPEGRVECVPEDDPDAAPRTAFRYADHALGRFMDEVRTRPWYDDTIFVLVADHGRQPRAVMTPDIGSFRIPLLIIAPGLVEPGREERLASQLDVAPTLLSLLGGSYRTCAFGVDLLAPGAPRRAMMCIGDYVAWMEDDGVLVWSPGGNPRPVMHAGPGANPRTPSRAQAERMESLLRATARVAYGVSREQRHHVAPLVLASSEAR